MPRDACRAWLRMCVWPIHQCGGRAEAAAQLKLQVIWSFNRCCILFESEETGFAIARISCPWSVVHVHSGFVDDAYKRLWTIQSAPLNAAYDMKFYSNFILAPVAQLFPTKTVCCGFFFGFSWGSCFIFLKFISCHPTNTQILFVLRLLWEIFRRLFGKIKRITNW